MQYKGYSIDADLNDDDESVKYRVYGPGGQIFHTYNTVHSAKVWIDEQATKANPSPYMYRGYAIVEVPNSNVAQVWSGTNLLAEVSGANPVETAKRWIDHQRTHQALLNSDQSAHIAQLESECKGYILMLGQREQEIERLKSSARTTEGAIEGLGAERKSLLADKAKLVEENNTLEAELQARAKMNANQAMRIAELDRDVAAHAQRTKDVAHSCERRITRLEGRILQCEKALRTIALEPRWTGEHEHYINALIDIAREPLGITEEDAQKYAEGKPEKPTWAQAMEPIAKEMQGIAKDVVDALDALKSKMDAQPETLADRRMWSVGELKGLIREFHNTLHHVPAKPTHDDDRR